jgi:hypothetical protein
MTDSQQPVLKVVTPSATEEEVAALIAVLSVVGAPAAAGRKPVPEWAAGHRRMRRTLPHGPGGWRASALPR